MKTITDSNLLAPSTPAKCKKVGRFSIEYNNKDSVEQTIDEIFLQQAYQFTTYKYAPLIIDAGSNIGIATLYFKQHYPLARVICFEPDPNAFKMLSRNISQNSIDNVIFVNAAVCNDYGETDFYGQIFVDSPDARGNSIIGTWGLQRKINNMTKVKSVKLSAYINSEVDLLKLDIEGAEQQVLEDLEQQGKLHYVRQMIIEVHHCEEMKHVNSIENIVAILKRNGYSLRIMECDPSVILPDQIKGWAAKIKPRFYHIKAHKL